MRAGVSALNSLRTSWSPCTEPTIRNGLMTLNWDVISVILTSHKNSCSTKCLLVPVCQADQLQVGCRIISTMASVADQVWSCSRSEITARFNELLETSNFIRGESCVSNITNVLNCSQQLVGYGAYSLVTYFTGDRACRLGVAYLYE